VLVPTKEKQKSMKLLNQTISVAAIALSILIFTSARAEAISGKVVGVSDGDTVTVLDAKYIQHKIRLAGIDAPEKKMPFGNRAKQLLSDLVFGKEVVAEIGKTDRYGREVGKILINGRDANLAMVEAGLAWHYKTYQKEQSANDRLLYATAEDQARSRRIGLWVDLDPIPPWDWRKASKK
jgi:endonuclease YncB( thermonuclease family)